MFSRAIRLLALSFPLALLVPGSALANTCNNFAIYTCAQSTPNTVPVIGQGPTNSSVGTMIGLITGNTFGVTMTGNGSAGDIIIIAAFTGPVGGTLNGSAFTTLNSFPEGGALGAISTTLQALGFGTSPTSFGYVDLHSPLSAGGTLSVNISGLPVGAVLYGMALNQVTTCTHGRHPVCSTNWQITNITPNSETGIIGRPPVVTPEPGTLSLLGTRLLGLAGIVASVSFVSGKKNPLKAPNVLSGSFLFLA
jgi:hypothetical protein